MDETRKSELTDETLEKVSGGDAAPGEGDMVCPICGEKVVVPGPEWIQEEGPRPKYICVLCDYRVY